MLKQAENFVRVEGILSEIDLKYGSFVKKSTGKPMNSIGGTIKVQVNQNINGEDSTLEVPIHMFASELKNDGDKNPAYQSIERIMNEFTSIAAAGGVANADCVRISQGRISMNEYYGRDGRLISFPRISASFVNKVKPDELRPEATFNTTFVVAKKMGEIDSEGIETGRFKITGIIPMYGGEVDVVEFVATNPKVISAVDSYWNENDTVSAVGRLNFSTSTKTVVKEVDFGEPQEQTFTTSVSELIITGGSASPAEGEFAYKMDEIKEGLSRRKDRLDASKEKSAGGGTRTAPAKNASGTVDLGF